MYFVYMTGNKIVFVVDDDVSCRKGITRLMRTSGYESREFDTVQEFLDVVDSSLSGCVLMEAGIDGLSGEKLRTDIQTHGLRLPIIIVTAHNDQETKREAQKMGAVGFFSKPVDGKALLNAVEWAIQSTQSQSKRKK